MSQRLRGAPELRGARLVNPALPSMRLMAIIMMVVAVVIMMMTMMVMTTVMMISSNKAHTCQSILPSLDSGVNHKDQSCGALVVPTLFQSR